MAMIPGPDDEKEKAKKTRKCREERHEKSKARVESERPREQSSLRKGRRSVSNAQVFVLESGAGVICVFPRSSWCLRKRHRDTEGWISEGCVGKKGEGVWIS